MMGVLLAVLLLLAGCDSLPGRPTEAERPLRPAEVTDFATLYGQNCAGCHGADGLNGAARPMNDPVYLALAGRERLVQLTAAGVPGTTMPGFAPAAGGMLTDRQVAIIADGMISAWGAAGALRDAGLPPYAGGAGDAEAGAAVFGHFCGSCHGADGRGGEKGGSVVDGAFLGLVSDQALRLAVICGRIDLGMPNWRGLVAGQPMTEQQIDDVVAWLVAQRPRFP
jgi:cytochrome c oxidase cbb3-type subunit 3/ubiquinol-cytochrome c reductase cytochrome c subunit